MNHTRSFVGQMLAVTTAAELMQGKKENNTKKYNVSKLTSNDVRQEFKLKLRNRFSCLKEENGEPLRVTYGKFIKKPQRF